MRGVELAADVQDLRVVHFAWAVHLVLIHAMQSLSRGRGRDDSRFCGHLPNGHLCGVKHMAINRHMPVLVVDDQGTMRNIVRGQLRQLGFPDVDEANSGAEALAKLGERHYGLIFSDWHMEEIGGLDLLRAVRCDPDLQQIPFIMVTGESRADNVIVAKRAGVSGYIIKPFDVQMLKAKIETVFATRSSPLPERQTVAVSEASVSMSTTEATQLKFPGRFTRNT
jgi:two-component system chemotaxis response regulator CheY